LEEDASVWFGSVLRGDNERILLGARTNVQDGCLLHTDMGYPLSIGSDCSIGHHAVLHGCTVGDNSLIGMGAILLNGVKVGRNCLVGANSLLTEGKVYPDNSLIVGSPARVIRNIDDAMAARLRDNAAHYVRNWRRYARGLEPIAEVHLV
jgi:carbonic anhydrase/acetyltransferase-like protein (isoleucine patch superfamily)